MNLEDLYKLHAAKVYSFFYLQSGNQQTAEDLTSQTFTILVEKMAGHGQPIDDPKKFLYGVMRNVWLMHLRKIYRQNEEAVESVDNFETYVSNEVDAKTTAELKRRAETFINRLPRQQKRVMELRLLQEMSIKEIAHHLGKDRNYVKTTYKRGLKRLKALAAAAVIVLAIGIGVATQPFRSNAVTAAELIQNVRQYGNSLRRQSLYGQESQTIVGPQAKQCEGLLPEASTYKTYVYSAPGGSVEAGYLYRDTPATGPSEESYYYNPGNGALQALATGAFSSPLPYLEGKQPAYRLADAQGKLLPDNKVEPITQNGRRVYSFYFRYEPVTSGVCDDLLAKLVVDAETFAPLEYSSYQGPAAPENLILRDLTTYVSKDVSEAEALRIMQAAGFDKDRAMPKLRDAKQDNHER